MCVHVLWFVREQVARNVRRELLSLEEVIPWECVDPGRGEKGWWGSEGREGPRDSTPAPVGDVGKVVGS